MRKWLWLVFIATFGICAMNVFAHDQAAVSAAKAAAESQPAPVPMPDGIQSPTVAAAPAVAVKAPINFGDFRSSTLTTKAWGALALRPVKCRPV